MGSIFESINPFIFIHEKRGEEARIPSWRKLLLSSILLREDSLSINGKLMADTSTFFSLPSSWELRLFQELSHPYMIELASFLQKEYDEGQEIYPERKNIFSALELTPFEDVKVVIMGQDPYHGPNQAHGLSFSVRPGVRTPPSLQNIYKELHNDLQIPIPQTGCLTPWAKQGVLLLNATLTVRRANPLSHHNKGWEKFTDAIISHLAKEKENIVFILWGKNAQEKCLKFKDEIASKHLILTAAHPSPYAAHNGFFGCRHFSKTNQYLEEHGKEPIDWKI